MTAAVVNVLRLARARIANSENWTQCGYYATNREESASLDFDVATCFCARGAVFAVDPCSNADEYLEMALGNEQVASWNDDPRTTHEDVMNLFDRAIAMAEADHG